MIKDDNRVWKGNEWKCNQVVVWSGPTADGTQYEMVCPFYGSRVEYFHTKEDAENYARAKNLVIVEWM